MSRKGLLIHYEYCTGCNTCVVACKQEHNHPVGICGIHLNEILTKMPDDRYRIDYLPFPTNYCDLCIDRTKRGELPSCAKHCQAAVISYGPVTELAKQMEDMSHGVMYTPR